MRMVHYYIGTAILLVPALLATLVSGAFHSGSQTHMLLGLFTSIGCVAQNTLLIMFMIVTGRVLRQAIAARSLPEAFLGELNEFFARRSAYPVALVAASVAVAAAVLGHGALIGVPVPVHMLVGLTACLVNLWALGLGVSALRRNQRLIDRAAALLDEIDARAASEEEPETDDPVAPFAYGPRLRWFLFAACVWLPYLYWGALVWHGDFERVSPIFLTGTAVVCALGVVFGLMTPRRQTA